MINLKYSSIEELRLIISSSNNISEVFKKLNLIRSGKTYKAFRDEANRLNIDISHLKSDIGKRLHNPIPIKDYFILGVLRTNCGSKKKILKYKLKEYKCETCSIGPEWNGFKLSLQLDHINGNPKDNRLENLRFLCPNCHSQTVTFGAKNRKI